MKIVSLEIKKIEIGKFFPKKNEAELQIAYNDGTDKEILKTVDIADPDGSADSIITELRKMTKEIHKEDKEGTIIDNFVNIVVKNEDELQREISKFIQTVSIKIGEINSKKEADGYLDMIRELKSLKLEF